MSSTGWVQGNRRVCAPRAFRPIGISLLLAGHAVWNLTGEPLEAVFLALLGATAFAGSFVVPGGSCYSAEFPYSFIGDLSTPRSASHLRPLSPTARVLLAAGHGVLVWTAAQWLLPADGDRVVVEVLAGTMLAWAWEMPYRPPFWAAPLAASSGVLAGVGVAAFGAFLASLGGKPSPSFLPTAAAIAGVVGAFTHVGVCLTIAARRYPARLRAG